VIGVDKTGRVVRFDEKPKQPAPLPDHPGRALVSMGNYLFKRQPLIEALLADARRSTDHDFGRSIIPEMVDSGRVYAYDFHTNDVPGVKPYEEQGYWRDVGTIEAYWESHMDLLGESPRFDLDNSLWPIRTGTHPGPPARFIGSDIDNGQVGEGSLIKRAIVRNSILGRSVWVNEGAVIEDSIVMDHTTVGKGARLRRAIVDRYNIIPADTEIGYHAEEDRRRYPVDRAGIVVVPRGGRREFLRGLEEL
jgi:glucose-1-phosphate adenylyltransferase